MMVMRVTVMMMMMMMMMITGDCCRRGAEGKPGVEGGKIDISQS